MAAELTTPGPWSPGLPAGEHKLVCPVIHLDVYDYH